MKNREVRMGVAILDVNIEFYKSGQRKATPIVLCPAIDVASP
jgi:hypothetical protein